jgi:hypothetical protein
MSIIPWVTTLADRSVVGGDVGGLVRVLVLQDIKLQ